MKRTILMLVVLLSVSAVWVSGEEKAPFDPAAAEKKLITATGKDKSALLNDLADHYLYKDQEKAISLCNESLLNIRQFPDLVLEGRAYMLKGVALRDQEKFDPALTELVKARALFQQARDEGMEAIACSFLGDLYIKMGRFPEAAEVIERAIPIETKLNDPRNLAIAYFKLGNVYYARGDQQKALENFLKSQQIAETNQILDAAPHIANSLGNVYSDLGEETKALEYYWKAYNLLKDTPQKGNTAMTLNNIACTYKNLKQYPQAERYFQETIDFTRKAGLREPEAKAEHNLGNLLGMQNNWSGAIPHYLNALRMKTDLNDLNGQALARKELANAHFQLKDLRKAKEQLLLAVPIFEKIKSTKLLADSYEQLSQVSAKLGDFRGAYESHQKFSETRNEILNREKNDKIVEMQQKYEAGERQKQIESLSKNNQILEQKSRIQSLHLSRARLQVFLGIALVLLLLTVGALFFRRYLYLLAFWKKRNYIGHFRLEGEIAQGGMGVIYRAKNLVADTGPVALKVLREEMAADEKQRRRFIQEGNIIDELDHPHIVKVYERGETNRRLYIAMEFLDGKPLAGIIREAAQRGEQIPLSLCLHLMRQTVAALASVHERAIVHRDITPGNIFVTRTGGDPNFVKLVDFGIAKSFTVTGLTEAGEILGTINYLSPETIEHREPTAASDIFSLGVVFYELLTLEKPFLGDDPLQVIRQVLEKNPLAPARFRGDIPADLDGLVLAMLEKHPENRPSGATVRRRLDGEAMVTA